METMLEEINRINQLAHEGWLQRQQQPPEFFMDALRVLGSPPQPTSMEQAMQHQQWLHALAVQYAMPRRVSRFRVLLRLCRRFGRWVESLDL